MRSDVLLIAVALGVCACGAAQAQERRFLVTVAPTERAPGFEKIKVSKAAVGSSKIVLWANSAIDPDCSEHKPGPTLTILEPPAHGQATISEEPFYMAFPPNNPRSACNQRKVPGHQAFYTAQDGYVGRDRVVLEGSSPEGHVRQITVDVDVR